MIMMELKVPTNVLQRSALLRSLSKYHEIRPVIVRDLKRYLKGYYGEKECCHYLSFLPEERYYIFHGLRLRDKKEFQMDLLILTQSFALIIEVKNISGKLKFEKGSKQMIREYNLVEEGLQNPILQVKRHRIQFLDWLNKMYIKALPVEYLVVISKTSTIIETTPDNMQIFDHLIYAESLIDKIEELENKYPNPRLNKKNIATLSETLLKEHLFTIPDILQTYKIPPSQLFTGVQCPCCKKYAMKYISANWLCPNCKCSSKKAHLQALDDFFFLINRTMTRKQFRDFLQIDNDLKAKYLLRSLNLPFTGTKRGTKYFRPPGYILSHFDEQAIEKGEYVIP
jgi:hypothetical protein